MMDPIPNSFWTVLGAIALGGILAVYHVVIKPQIELELKILGETIDQTNHHHQ